jgi:soluble lytic murein transglycosylase-like protein
MQPKILFCNRCRGMKQGWNRRYIVHGLFCKQWLRSACRSVGLAVIAAALLLMFAKPTPSVFSASTPERPVKERGLRTAAMPLDRLAVRLMDTFLERQKVPELNRSRLAESIVATAKKYDLDAMLIASIIIVESRGNQFAISAKDSIGIMQIHLPTWGLDAERKGMNLLRIEDNVDFGAYILKDYVRRFGVWGGVKRYNGFFADNPASVQSADDYVTKVQQLYGRQLPEPIQAASH